MNVNKLRGKMAEHGVSTKALATALDCSRSTLWRKLKDGSFTLAEADTLCNVLQIVEPVDKVEIFLPSVSQK